MSCRFVSTPPGDVVFLEVSKDSIPDRSVDVIIAVLEDKRVILASITTVSYIFAKHAMPCNQGFDALALVFPVRHDTILQVQESLLYQCKILSDEQEPSSYLSYLPILNIL